VCYYCDFHFRVAMKDRDAMLVAMKKEIALRKDYLRVAGTDNGKVPVETLYFGGGTPSVLSIDELAGLLETVYQYYTLALDAEITLEANPDDLADDYLAALHHLGFNRLSIGIQSFFDDDLQWMNRRHCAREAVQSVEAARRHGFHNINIDLIYGLPSMTPDRWQDNLEQALALDVPHLSAYHLTIEPRTVFGRRQARGEAFAISEDESVRQFDALLDTMEKAGYEHYEISNFACPGFRSSHNAAYWQQKPYIGIGPAAHSCDGQSRQWNISSNSGYIAALEAAKPANPDEEGGRGVWFERERLTPAEQYNDCIMVSLRTAWGVDIGYIRTHFGDVFAGTFLQQAATYIQNGYMQERAGVFTLTRKGKMIADRIASDLFYG
jgi:oxygen-independent coproporphyrinogen-3 oxidase